MNNTFISIIYFIAFSHALLLAIALWRRTSSGNSGRLLAALIAILAYKLFEGGSIYSGLYHYVPHLLDLMPLVVMVMGPIFYAYTRHVAAKEPFQIATWLLHLLPWISMWLYFNGADVFRSAELKIAMYDSWAESSGTSSRLPTLTIMILLAVKAHLTTYLALSWRELNRFADVAPNLRSDNSPEQIIQLRSLAIALIVLESIWVSLFIAQQFLGIGTLDYVSQIWLLFIAVIVIAMGYSGLQNPAIVFSHEELVIAESSNRTENVSNSLTENQKNIQYINSALPESTLNAIAQEIEKALVSQQLFLDPKLTLTELARELGLKSHTVSQVINQGLNSSFYQLINSYRVQHAINLLESNQLNWTIERIALESGFNNRVTFNKAFKQTVGCTASEYKKLERDAG